MRTVKPEVQVIIDKYPGLFKGQVPRSGFYVGLGWYPLLETLCPILEYHILSLPSEDQKEIFVAQVKEKFGGLRFYLNRSNPYLDGAIAMAENMSYHICETCAQPGSRRTGGWIRVLCDRCNEFRLRKKGGSDD